MIAKVVDGLIWVWDLPEWQGDLLLLTFLSLIACLYEVWLHFDLRYRTLSRCPQGTRCSPPPSATHRVPLVQVSARREFVRKTHRLPKALVHVREFLRITTRTAPVRDHIPQCRRRRRLRWPKSWSWTMKPEYDA